jgi:hypothetical protein
MRSNSSLIWPPKAAASAVSPIHNPATTIPARTRTANAFVVLY